MRKILSFWLILILAVYALYGQDINDDFLDACRFFELESMQDLLDRGADINARGKHGETGLMIACRLGRQTQVIQWLLSKGADTELKDHKGNMALTDAFNADHLDLVELLLGHGADINATDDKGWTMLIKASRDNDLNMVQSLVKRGIDVNIQDNDGRTALTDAKGNGIRIPRVPSMEILKYLLQNGANPGIPDNDGRTPMHEASYDEWDRIKLLAEYGADVNTLDRYTPLMDALRAKNIEMVKFLLGKGADVSIKCRGRTPWEQSFFSSNKDLPNWVLSKIKDINHRNEKGQTPLIFACTGRGRYKNIKFILEMGADVNAQTADQTTALMEAINACGQYDIVMLLLEYGADINIQTKEGCSALMLAAKGNKEHIIEPLIHEGADLHAVNNNGENALEIAKKHQYKNIVKIIQEAMYSKSQE
jgi:ankyrin repeat protein